MSLYLKIKDAADIYLTKTVAASTYATQATAVTHTANSAVGSATRSVYVDANGKAKALSGTVGSATEPIYLLNGVFTKTSGGGGSQVAVTSGTISNGGIIPVPNGFTRAQCHYAVWLMKYGFNTYSTRDVWIFCSVDQSTGKVTCGSTSLGEGASAPNYPRYSITAQYLCIAVK